MKKTKQSRHKNANPNVIQTLKMKIKICDMIAIKITIKP